MIRLFPVFLTYLYPVDGFVPQCCPVTVVLPSAWCSWKKLWNWVDQLTFDLLTVAHRLRCFLHIDTDDFFVHCCFGSVLLVTRWLFSLVLHRLPWINTSILSHHSSSLCLSFIDPTCSRVGRNFSSTRSWTSSCTTCTIISEGFTLFHSSLLIQIYSVPDSQQDSTRA